MVVIRTSNFSTLKKEVFEANVALEGKGSLAYSLSHITIFDKNNEVLALKPYGKAMSALKSKDMLITNLEGKVIEGQEDAPLDAKIHAILYKNLNGVNAICSSHSPYTTAWAQAKRSIPTYGLAHASYIPCDIPVTQTLNKHDLTKSFHMAVANSILKLFADSDIVITGMNLGNVTTDSAYIHTECAYTPLEMAMVLVAGYGAYTWGSSVSKALHYKGLLEYIAKTAFLTEKLNPKISSLDEAVVSNYFEEKFN